MLTSFPKESFVPQEPANPKSLRFKLAALATAALIVVVIWALSVTLKPPPINIVSVEIEAAGIPPPYFYQGFTLSAGQHFSYTFRYPFTYPQRATLSSLNVNTVGFTLTSFSPSLPYTLPANSSVTFTVSLIAPNRTYNGPLTLTFGVYL
jgi:hypothetical protein